MAKGHRSKKIICKCRLKREARGRWPAPPSDRWVLGARLAMSATLPWRRNRGPLAPPRTWSTCVIRPTRVRKCWTRRLLRWSVWTRPS
ncbi:hypothetical protein I79_021663 [Cricetulus griseus]|uniref:Uncharacterized protein n=1 Tax=Cricetulus griseus TaxID=10029 RepID=G3ID90_CRIGR|nr:hypothetical protein I79_021663 [Cricetulus griseus]